MRLSEATLARLPANIARFSYDRTAQKLGIVHFGIGAFHRAHQAWYTDLAMDAGECDWAIAGVSLRSGTVASQLKPQDGLYSLTERGGGANATRVIRSVRGVWVADAAAPAVQARVAAPGTHLVTITVTEKGYCRAPDGTLDLAQARGNTLYRHLAGAILARRRAATAGLTLLSCDNLPGNGELLRALLAQYLEAEAPAGLDWFLSECACPNSMVDRIVPAATEADLAAAERTLGLRDEGAVFAERFSQWVIEDRFAGPRPGWEKVGAQLVCDVAPYETAKLRMLNGAHSALAYCGLERGHEFVHQAIADPPLRALVERVMRHEAAPSFSAAPGQDLEGYADALLARFADPALNHRLAQIAMDGSQKIPPRWLETLAFHQHRGTSCLALLEALAAWLRHVRGDRRPVDDPLAATLAELWASAGAAGIAAALFGPHGLFARNWQADEPALAALAGKLG